MQWRKSQLDIHKYNDIISTPILTCINILVNSIENRDILKPYWYSMVTKITTLQLILVLNTLNTQNYDDRNI